MHRYVTEKKIERPLYNDLGRCQQERLLMRERNDWNVPDIFQIVLIKPVQVRSAVICPTILKGRGARLKLMRMFLIPVISLNMYEKKPPRLVTESLAGPQRTSDDDDGVCERYMGCLNKVCPMSCRGNCEKYTWNRAAQKNLMIETQ